jgi:hypothetical protein
MPKRAPQGHLAERKPDLPFVAKSREQSLNLLDGIAIDRDVEVVAALHWSLG